MEIKVLDKKGIAKAEMLRKDVYHFDSIGTFYINEFLNNREYALGMIDHDLLIGALYFHVYKNILMIDQLFVKVNYQNKGIGKELLRYLFNRKEYLEELTGKELDLCRIEPQNSKSEAIYEKIGFVDGKNDKDALYRKL